MRERRLVGHREREYELSPEEYDELLKRQGGVCGICSADSSAGSNNGRRSLGVDHDHLTGTVRGLLCNNCNRAIGLLNDDPAVLRAALDYLEATP